MTSSESTESLIIRECIPSTEHFISAKQSMGMLSDVAVVHMLSHSPFPSHLGPQFHNRLTESSVTVIPREGRSAGLSAPGQCFQCSAGTSLHISVTLLRTNCFYSLPCPAIQCSATWGVSIANWLLESDVGRQNLGNTVYEPGEQQGRQKLKSRRCQFTPRRDPSFGCHKRHLMLGFGLSHQVDYCSVSLDRSITKPMQ